MRKITIELMENFKNYLIREEKSSATIEKYVRDISAFTTWIKNNALQKETVLAYKRYLTENYAPASVNSMLSSINSFFEYYKWYEFRVRLLKIQKQIFSDKEKELSKAEYEKLL